MKKVLIVLLVLVAGTACKREQKDYVGPAYISAPAGFSVLSFSSTPATSVDFTTTSVLFDATFSNPVTWKLTITGETSGATHSVSATSNGFTGVEWKGQMDGAVFFRAGENATATLSFFGTTTTASLTLAIIKVPDYTTCGTFPLYGDFETPTKVEPQPTPPYYSPYWASFNYPNPIPNVVQGVDSVAVDYYGNPVPACQGKKYYFIKGLGNQDVFVSGLQYFGPVTPAIPADPDNIWVNMYIYGTGDPNASVDLEYQEADIDGTTAGYQGTDDDAFVAHITLDHLGWKLFSFRYSDLVPSANADFGGSGNHIHEPDRLKSFDLVLLKKNDPHSPVEVYFDFPIITIGGPFKPCN